MISNENLSRNKMFLEAVKRMKLMKVNSCDSQIIEQKKNLYFKIVVNHMEKTVRRKELTEEERQMITNIEAKYNFISYYFIQDEGIWPDGCTFPRYTLLYVGENVDEYEMVREECILRCGTIPAYIVNMEDVDCSEFTEIEFHNVGGCLINLS